METPPTIRPWPRHARAAISLTYDDNVPSHLDHAIPDLEAAGFRGTFYIVTGEKERLAATGWKEAFERGHEMGNHTVTHPCRGGQGRLQAYSPAQIREEIVAADDWLNTHIGFDPDRSFAYPCGNMTIGPDDAQDSASYFAAIRLRHYAARAVGPKINLPAEVPERLLEVDAVCLDDRTPDALEQMTAYCQRAAELGGWGVLVFHGIGGDWLSTSRETHRRLLEHLAEGAERYWVAPFRDVARHLAGK